MNETIAALVEDIATNAPTGTPIIVLVDDYRERADLAGLLTEEAALFGINVATFSRFDEASERLPQLEAACDRAAILLVDSNEAATFGSWLDASREALPTFVRFVAVLVFRRDLPAFAKNAPAFMSWAKVNEFAHLAKEIADTQVSEVEAELRRMQEATGLSPEKYIEAWQRGDIPDTYRNTTWLNLAYAATGQDAG
jgi:hypothetical protein